MIQIINGKLIDGNKVAVVYSPGYGSELPPIDRTNGELCQLIVNGDMDAAYKMVDALNPWYNPKYPFNQRREELEVEWLIMGTKYRIREYDGNESIETLDDTRWSIA